MKIIYYNLNFSGIYHHKQTPSAKIEIRSYQREMHCYKGNLRAQNNHFLSSFNITRKLTKWTMILDQI